MKTQDNDGVPRTPMRRLFQTPESEYEACVKRHERVRITMLALAVLAIFLSDVLFFTLHTILPLIVTTAVSILLYMYINKRLRGRERQLSQRA